MQNNDRSYDPVTFKFKTSTIKKPSSDSQYQKVGELLGSNLDEKVFNSILSELLTTQNDLSFLPEDSCIFEGFESAILGYDLNENVAYSYDKCVDILIDTKNLSLEEAVGYVDENMTTKEKTTFIKYI